MGPKEGAPILRLDDVGVTFPAATGDVEVLRGVALDVRENEFLTVVGRSGSGKSTLLSVIAGLRRPTYGQTFFRGVPIDGPNPHIGYVTQQDNLLPWRTVEANISLALELRNVKPSVRRAQVDEMIEIVGLQGFAKHRPSQLSGGMRKRVTLARTLIYRPAVLLLDEPFGSLDAQLKSVLQDELLSVSSKFNCTFVFVTHDLEEAVLLGDRVVLLGSRPGRVKLAEEVSLERPRDLDNVRFTAEFQRIYMHLLSELRSSPATEAEAS